ncbi:hypothetical protein [Thermofilum sp.]|jgi:hypothetical protein|uniref:hypothetical protein n=1 Tax=Thermofilum sp. TaxID=1961369 RepID=UPI00258EE44E|nr:hypothetical protein [Thermofilum sp.]
MPKQKQALEKVSTAILAILVLTQTLILVPISAQEQQLFPILPTQAYHKIYTATYWNYDAILSSYPVLNNLALIMLGQGKTRIFFRLNC